MVQPWNATDIDADFSEIGDGIYVKAGANSDEVLRRRLQIGVWRHVELESLQRREHARGFVCRIDAEMRHRPVSGDALERQAEPKRALVPDQRYVRGGLRHDDGAGTSEKAGARQMKCPLAADFLPRGNDENRPAGAFKLPGHVADSRDESCYPAFHVRRTAAVHLAVDNLARKRIDT